MTRKFKCTCVHSDQDQTYGDGIRIFNLMGDGSSYRCTVCMRVQKTDTPAKPKKS